MPASTFIIQHPPFLPSVLSLIVVAMACFFSGLPSFEPLPPNLFHLLAPTILYLSLTLVGRASDRLFLLSHTILPSLSNLHTLPWSHLFSSSYTLLTSSFSFQPSLISPSFVAGAGSSYILLTFSFSLQHSFSPICHIPLPSLLSPTFLLLHYLPHLPFTIPPSHLHLSLF